jgi:outer membrane lipoprotein-sorting protein
MKNQRNLFIIAIILLTGVLSATNLTGRDIMVKVDERDDGDDRHSKMEMTLINHRGKTRVRKVTNYKKDYGKDSKSVMVFLQPADVKGTGFLSWEYDKEDKDDDRWLYMPALRKVRRISGASNDDYFMGSDFTYDDMGDRNVDEDKHKLLGEETQDGIACWKVESTPKDPKDMYVKKISWINKDTDMVIKVDYYDKLGLMKRLKLTKIEQINGIWTAKEMFMDNFREKHQTKLEFSDIVYNKNLSDNLFKVSTIERGRLK